MQKVETSKEIILATSYQSHQYFIVYSPKLFQMDLMLPIVHFEFLLNL
jgi:hypothetical protein